MPNVFLNARAYARLKAAKPHGQSFSDYVLQNVKPAAVDLDAFFGCCKGMDAPAMIANIRRNRNRSLSADVHMRSSV